ncbi:MAG: XdhC family protein [Chloroflexota bacterium]
MASGLGELLSTAHQRLQAGEPVAMATVVATRGSTPQKAGAHMLIAADGQMYGTIGGGCIEAEVWSEASRLLKRGESGLREFILADDPEQPGGDVCGGTMEVFIDVLKPAARRVTPYAGAPRTATAQDLERGDAAGDGNAVVGPSAVDGAVRPVATARA